MKFSLTFNVHTISGSTQMWEVPKSSNLIRVRQKQVIICIAITTGDKDGKKWKEEKGTES